MNKVILIALLLCTGLVTAGCEKTYSVAEFKKDQKLMEEWNAKCGFAGTSKNCENLRLAQLELEKEYEAKAEERAREDQEELNKAFEKARAARKAREEKWEAEQKAKEQAEKQQDSN